MSLGVWRLRGGYMDMNITGIDHACVYGAGIFFFALTLGHELHRGRFEDTV